jgi:hypothetical protein
MKKLGICVTDFGHSQLSYRILKEVNGLMLSRFDTPISIFYENLDRPIGKLLTGYFNMSESWLFNGALVATSHTTANKMMTILGPRQKIYYVQDLDFLNNVVNSDIFYNLFCNSNMEILCRSQNHKKVIENNFNVKVKGVVENFDIKSLLEFVRGQDE